MRLRLKSPIRAIGLVLMVFVSVVAISQPASAAGPLCSGPLAVGLGGLDTMRVCISWDSQTLVAETEYFTGAATQNHDVNVATWIEIDGGSGEWGKTVCGWALVKPNSMKTCTTDLVGNLSGNQANVGRARALDPTSVILSTPLVVA